MHCSKARFVSASLLLTGLLIAQATGQTTTPAADSPAMEVRLQRLCDQLEKQRETLHIPGMAIAVIKDDKIILSRGFGVRDIESNLPATDETLFAIGSSTKAFTATLIGMLMDEGTMNWDEPPSKYLPNFHLSDAEADSQLAIRDLLCHRMGVGNADLLWAAGTASREKILETVCGAKLLSPFRKQFHYNNVMFLAAGQAAGRAAGKDWDAILAERILKPLGMASSTTSYESAQQNPMLSKGYDWDKEASEFKRKPMRNLSNIAPAGAINSNVKDMAQWVRLQLGRGEIDGKRLVSKERIEETWKPHITMAGDISYGLGWMLHKWNNHKLVEHGGNIDGFGAQVAFLPDAGVGYVLLTNVTATPLQQMSIGLVFDSLLGNWSDAETPLDLADVQPYLGKYHFDVLKNNVTVLIQNGKLAVDVPGQMVFELKPPDAAGKRYFELTDTIAVAFDRNDAGEVTALRLFQAGLEFELPRDGVMVPTEITAAEARPYLGAFHSDTLKSDVKILHRNGRLAIDVPGQMVYDLHLPDENDLWKFRAKKTIAIKFNADESGQFASLTMFQDGKEFAMPRVQEEPNADLPTLDAVMALREKAYGTERLASLKNIRMTGTIDFVHQGVHGSYLTTAAGLDRYRQSLDLGPFGYITSSLDDGRAWNDSAFAGFEELQGKFIEQTRLQHPLVIAADWQPYFKSIALSGVETVNDRKMYVIELTLTGDMRCDAYIDAESGLIVKEELELLGQGPGAIMTTIMYDDHQLIDGVLLPRQITMSNDVTGSMIVKIERVETNLELPADEFVLKPRH